MIAAVLEVEAVDDLQVVEVDFAEGEMIGRLGDNQISKAMDLVAVDRIVMTKSQPAGIESNPAARTRGISAVADCLLGAGPRCIGEAGAPE